MKEENKSRARGYKVINRVFEERTVQSFCRKATFEQRFELNVEGNGTLGRRQNKE